MGVIYPGLITTQVFVRDEFSVHSMFGDAHTPFPTFSTPSPDGSSMNDAVSISNKPARVCSFTSQRMQPAWVDAGKGFINGGGKCWIWDEPFQYWCVSDWRRPNNQYTIECDIHHMNPGTSQGINISAGEHLALLMGNGIVDGNSRNGFWIWEDHPGGTEIVDAVNECCFIVIRAIPVP